MTASHSSCFASISSAVPISIPISTLLIFLPFTCTALSAGIFFQPASSSPTFIILSVSTATATSRHSEKFKSDLQGLRSEHELLRRARITLYARQSDPDHTTAKSEVAEGQVWGLQPLCSRAVPLDKKVVCRRGQLLQTQVLWHFYSPMHGDDPDCNEL